MHRFLPHILAGLTAAGLVLGFPSESSADLYKYRTASGDMLITTEKRPELELVEIISSDGSDKSKSDSRPSDSAEQADRQKRRSRARQRHAGRDYDEDDFDDLIQEASAAYEVPAPFIKAVIRVESNFQPDAVSSAGAQGLMQLMPRTAESLNVTEPFDPRQNIFGGTKFLRILIDRYEGDINLILAAYNAGDAAVTRYEGIPYPQTRDYVSSVYYWYKIYSKQEGSE